MSAPEDAIKVIGAIEAFLPIVVGLVKDLKGIATGSSAKPIEQILQEADQNWTAVLEAAKKELGQ
jgi:hypothetical protein